MPYFRPSLAILSAECFAASVAGHCRLSKYGLHLRKLKSGNVSCGHGDASKQNQKGSEE